MMAGLLLFAFVLVTLLGVIGISRWCIARRDARALAAFRAQQLVAWAQFESAVLAAERDFDGGSSHA